MSSEFNLEATSRTDLGKGASRRLRRLENRVAGIVYGPDQAPAPISLASNHINKLTESEAFFTSLVNLSIDGKAEKVVVKDMQRHPASDAIMHVDFLRIDPKHKITMHVPLHFINYETCPGVKLHGGSFSQAVTDIEVSCLPKDLPEYIEVDMGQLNSGENVHISDLTLPNGVSSVALSHGEDHDLLLAAINAPRGGLKEEGDEEAGEE